MSEKHYGIHFEGSRLFLFFEGFQAVIEAESGLGAWISKNNKWTPYSPDINIAKHDIEYIGEYIGVSESDFRSQFLKSRLEDNWKRPLSIITNPDSKFGHSAGEPLPINPLVWKEENQKYIRACLNRFFDTIPKKTKDAASNIEWNQWKILKWARDYECFCDMLRMNPALALCICFASRFVRLGGRKPKSFYTELLHKKQKEIAAFFGFSNREAIASILKRISPDCLRIYDLLQLRDILNSNEDLFKVLCHTKNINLAVLSYVGYSIDMPPSGSSLTANFLNEIAERFPKGDNLLSYAGNQAASEFYRYSNLFLDLINRYGAVQINSVSELLRRHDRMVEELNKLKVGQNIHFPNPPIQGNEAIQHISTMHELAEEGKVQKNCIVSYDDKILTKSVFAYRVLKPERATLSIRKNKGTWEIDQLQCAGNTSVSGETAEFVSRWLNENQKKKKHKA